MICILQMVDSLSAEARATILPMLKSWLEEDEGFIDSLQGAEDVYKRQDVQLFCRSLSYAEPGFAVDSGFVP